MRGRNSVLVSRSLYQIGLVTLLAAIVWVVIGVYLTVTKSVNIEVDKTVIEPLVTKIDLDVVEQLTSRLKIEARPGDDTIEVSSENELIN